MANKLPLPSSIVGGPLTSGGPLQIESLETIMKNVTFDMSHLGGSLEHKFLMAMQRLTRRHFFEEPHLYDIFIKVKNGNH